MSTLCAVSVLVLWYVFMLTLPSDRGSLRVDPAPPPEAVSLRRDAGEGGTDRGRGRTPGK